MRGWWSNRDERAEADRRYRAAREELAQANRLASLGQITAGVAHEINQPVAAIRTFAENGATLIDRDAPEQARENLARIVDLTARIGTITAELRAFARRRTPVGGKRRRSARCSTACCCCSASARAASCGSTSPASCARRRWSATAPGSNRS